MKLPFTVDQFLAVFSAYNTAIWPTQFLLVGIAILILIGAFSQRFAPFGAGAIAFLWGWSGLVYHLIFFRPINGAAIVFGLLFLVQAGVLVGEWRTRLRFRFTPSLAGWVGATLVLYALLLYPMLGYVVGHAYPATPTFGAPCPVTIFTLGVLLWSERPLRWYVYAIPMAWGVIGTSAAASLGMLEDYGLAVAALAFVYVIVASRRPDRASLSGWSVAR